MRFKFYSGTMVFLQAPPQQEIDRQQAVVESTADCIVPRLPQVIICQPFSYLNICSAPPAVCLVNQPTLPSGCDDNLWSP